jgi:hypothetical protein
MGIAFARWDRGEPERCPSCTSYRVTTDSRWDDDGDKLEHMHLCEVCGWEEILEPSTKPANNELAEDWEPPSSPPDGECVEGAIGTFEDAGRVHRAGLVAFSLSRGLTRLGSRPVRTRAVRWLPPVRLDT